MASRRRIWAVALLGVLYLLSLYLLSPPAPGAAIRYAAPTGGGTACTPVTPCDIQTAVEDAAVVDGDEVILLPGTYSTGTNPLVANDGIYIHGAAGAARPLISSNSGFAVVMGDSGGTIENVEVRSTAGGIALIVGKGWTAQRVIAIATANGAIGCYTAPDAARPSLLRDSACIGTGSGATALYSSLGVTPGNDAVARLRNVTAVATGPSSGGIEAASTGNGGSVTVKGRSVIASGTDSDISAVGGTGGSAAIADLSDSNYDSQLELSNGSVTDPGSGSNQTPPPLLVNPAAGDVHQRAGSFTIDRGSGDVSAERRDLDGGPRWEGAAPDIGSDEFGVQPKGTKCLGETATIVASATSRQLSGTEKRDVIVGTEGPDVILSGAGRDLVCSLGGRDTIRAGSGPDKVKAAGAGDKLFGQGGGDRLLGGGGRDRINGGAGKDQLTGQGGVDHLAGGRGRDRCGGSGEDRIAGCE